MPAVVVTGARQTGKSTLARDLIPVRRCFLSLDDLEWGQGSRGLLLHAGQALEWLGPRVLAAPWWKVL